MDISQTTTPKSDQQNFDDYDNGVTRVVTVTEVTAGSAEQPVEVHLAEFPGRPYKPNKSMRRVLVAAWGPEASAYAGRRMELYGDPTVKFGGDVKGGIKIAALSHIEKPVKISLTVARGRRAPHTVEPLVEAQAPSERVESRATKAVEWFNAKGVTRANLEAHVGKPFAEWSPTDVEDLKSNSDAIVKEATS